MAKPIAAAAPAVVRRPVKRLFRGFGVATSDYRPLPDYLIIGTHRGGTTSLHSYLRDHPCVAPTFPRLQNVKGVRYFDQNHFRGIGWYRSHFPTVAYRAYLQRLHGGPVLTGDASSYYLFHPAAAERAAKDVPQAKIIALLRDPVERAYSHWRRERRDGSEPLESFEDAIAAEPGRLAGEEERILSDERYYSYVHENFSYVTQGLYLESLRRWLERYPGEQVHIEVSERFLADPQAAYDRVLRFLGLSPFSLRDAERLNVTDHRKEQQLGSETRRELTARFAPHNRRLEEYLGIELGWGGQ
jgi:Sulfotransferase domain